MTLYDASTVTYSSAAVTYDGGTPSPSPYPLPGIYIAFDDNPYTASPAWTEITQYVRGFSTHRGRSSDFDQFDTGTAQLVLDNRDRRFDPFYTSGPYYGKLLPRRQIRIIGQADGTNYDVFRGYIAGWPVTWSEAGKDSTVTIQAFDALGLMANEILPTDWPYYYTSGLNPWHYYRCNDSRGTATINDYGSAGRDLNLNGTRPPFFETPRLADGFPNNAAFMVNYNTGALSAFPLSVTQNFSVCGWLQFNGGEPGVPTIGFDVRFGTVACYAQFYPQPFGATPGGFLSVNISSAAYGWQYQPTAVITSAAPRFWAINVNPSAQTLQIWIDGVDVTPARASITPLGSFAVDYVSFAGLSVQDFCVFDRHLTTGEIAALFNYGTGRLAETTTARMNRLVGTTDFASTLTAFTSAPVATVSEIGSGAGVIPEMQLVADSEGGELYVSKSGVLTTTARFDVFNATRSATPQATITDSGAGLEYGTELLIEYDADNLKNDITVQFSGNGEVNAYSDALIETYGGAATTIETQLADPTSANQLALLELGVEGALVPRISPIDLTPNTAASDWQTILGLELLDRVTFKRTPTVGNQFSRDALINAIDHQVVPGIWNTQVTLSMRYTSPLTLDDDVLGTLDFNYLG